VMLNRPVCFWRTIAREQYGFYTTALVADLDGLARHIG
jgi:hypothetical protein